jgi:hypothetical protein
MLVISRDDRLDLEGMLDLLQEAFRHDVVGLLWPVGEGDRLGPGGGRPPVFGRSEAGGRFPICKRAF